RGRPPAAALERARRGGARRGTPAVLRGNDAGEGPADPLACPPAALARPHALARALAVPGRHQAGAHQAPAPRAAAPPGRRPPAQPVLAHIPEKWAPVLRQGYAPLKVSTLDTIAGCANVLAEKQGASHASWRTVAGANPAMAGGQACLLHLPYRL